MMQGRAKYLFVAWLSLGASAWAIEYNIQLEPGQISPPPTLNGANPSGTATVDVNTITGDVSVTGTFADLSSNASAIHIHGLAPAGAGAGVLLPLTVDAATSGSLSGGGTLAADNLAGLLQGETYVNLHSGNNPGGEIRGQIVDSDIKVYELALTTSAANPPPNLGDATPSGTATVVVDASSGLVEISGAYTGTTSNTSAVHLHGLLADPGENTGVLIGLVASGGETGTFSGSGTLDEVNLAGLLDGRTYLNLHTATNPVSELRAQVVPEPGSLSLIALGLVTIYAKGRRVRRSRRR